MKRKKLPIAIFALCVFFVLLSVGCDTNGQTNKEESRGRAAYEVDYGSLYFDSIEQLRKAIKDYPSCLDPEDIPLYKINRFDEITVDYYPQMMNETFVLWTVEVNPYRIFYYYVPSGAGSFDSSAGVLVTVPREEGATVESVKKQFGVSAETDGSVFVPEIRSWFVPVGKNYYEISFPESMPNCEKRIIKMIRND
ncbi:MAG: hypothetical protein II192_06115 [Clostridia bacterium]|nr:hypothetical protein [Clostridia bacterium]